jgi:hypothetical protein
MSNSDQGIGTGLCLFRRSKKKWQNRAEKWQSSASVSFTTRIRRMRHSDQTDLCEHRPDSRPVLVPLSSRSRPPLVSPRRGLDTFSTRFDIFSTRPRHASAPVPHTRKETQCDGGGLHPPCNVAGGIKKCRQAQVFIASRVTFSRSARSKCRHS